MENLNIQINGENADSWLKNKGYNSLTITLDNYDVLSYNYSNNNYRDSDYLIVDGKVFKITLEQIEGGDQMQYTVIVTNTEDGLCGEVPALPGCIATGNSLEDLRHNLLDCVTLWLNSHNADGYETPDDESFWFGTVDLNNQDIEFWNSESVIGFLTYDSEVEAIERDFVR